MTQHTGSHKNSLNLLGENYLNESHWPMRRIRLLECIHYYFEKSFNNNKWIVHTRGDQKIRFFSP